MSTLRSISRLSRSRSFLELDPRPPDFEAQTRAPRCAPRGSALIRFNRLVLDSEDIDMPDATGYRSMCSARGSGIENGRFRLALHPSGLTAETEVEVDHLRREFMLVEITNGFAMVAKLRNGPRLQSLAGPDHD